MDITMHFSFKEVLHTGWQLFKKNWKFIILLGISTVLLQVLIELVQQGVMHRSPFLGFVLWLAGTIISIIITLGWAKVNLAMVHNHQPTWSTFRSTPDEWARLIKVMLWSILYAAYYTIITVTPFALIGVVGLLFDIAVLQKLGLVTTGIAFVVAALYITIRFQFATLAAVESTDASGSSRDIFKKSVALTDGQFWHLVGWLLASALVVIGGMILAGVGLIVAIPVVTLAQTKIYTILKSKHGHAKLKHEAAE